MISEYRFYMPIAGRIDQRGRLVPVRLRERLFNALFPPKALYRVVSIDDIAGTFTVERI